MRHLGIWPWIVVAIISFCAQLYATEASNRKIDGRAEDMTLRAVEVLTKALREEKKWVKVHAAEALLSLDYSDEVAEIFEKERKMFEASPYYRIGIWRVLARSSRNDKEYQCWVSKIRDAFIDEESPDRVHAIEALGKLGYKASEDELHAIRDFETASNSSNRGYARWVLANSGGMKEQNFLTAMLDSEKEKDRMDAAYALRFLSKLSEENIKCLLCAAERERNDSEARVYIISATCVQAKDEAIRKNLKPFLINYLQSEKIGEIYEACEALAECGDDNEITALTELLVDDNPDIRVAAAKASICIYRRKPN